MENWARWKDGAPIGVALTRAYELEARGRRAPTSNPLISGEAMGIDIAVEALLPEQQQAIREHWLRGYIERTRRGPRYIRSGASIEIKAAHCRCSVRTFYRRLERAHARIAAHIAERRRIGQRIEGALAAAHYARLEQRLRARGR